MKAANLKAKVKMSTQSTKRGISTSATAALALMVLALVPASLQAKVIKVPSKAIHTIQEGVDAAAPGDMVLVLPGTYLCEEGTAVYIYKPGLKLKAAGPVKIVGPGSGSSQGIFIDVDNASVEGFDLTGFGRGIVAFFQSDGTQTQITANTISGCSGVSLELRGSANYEVGHNTVIGGTIGIFLAPAPATNPQHHLHHNTVTDAEWQGIMVATAPGSRLDHNVCNNNFWEGIYLAGSPNSTAEHNRTDNNGWAGVEVALSPGSVVIGNNANSNALGIYSWGSCESGTCGYRFERNVATGNSLYDLACPQDTGNTYLNNRAGTAVPSLEFWDVKLPK